MNILDIQNASIISKTSLSRKLTIGGKTKAYPVYRVRLDYLFYNDQNDRIATWITQYNNDTANAALSTMDREAYNNVIEKFIVDSNPEAIEKTKKNIALVNQREPGVILSDGRIIDGNRRFTCLRMLQRESSQPLHFETVILTESAENDKKLIKMLELTIQHGEEQRVDYNQIDLVIGAYHDIEETHLLTYTEYAASTNTTEAEIIKRVEIARLIIQFLEFIGVPKQYHIARELTVYSVFVEILPILKKCESPEDREALTISVFNNTMLSVFIDQKKYIRNIRAIMAGGYFPAYIEKQREFSQCLAQRRSNFPIRNKADLDAFKAACSDIISEMQVAMDSTVLQSKKTQARNEPAQLVTKSISMLDDVDTAILKQLNGDEKQVFGMELQKISDRISYLQEEAGVKLFVPDPTPVREPEPAPAAAPASKEIILAPQHEDEAFVICMITKHYIRNLNFALQFTAVKFLPAHREDMDYIAYFVDSNNEPLCAPVTFKLQGKDSVKAGFSLDARASACRNCYLILKSTRDAANEAQQKIPFSIML